jgi:hypothetical protein
MEPKKTLVSSNLFPKCSFKGMRDLRQCALKYRNSPSLYSTVGDQYLLEGIIAKTKVPMGNPHMVRKERSEY